MAVLTTPTIQTVYGSIIDQANFQKSGVYATTSPSVYLTRILSRMMAAAHSPNSVLTGLDVTATSGLNTRTVTFTLSPGSMVIDSHIVHFGSPTIISTDLIPLTTPSKLRVGIFAAYTFNAATAESAANDVVFSSYLFDMDDNLIAPTLFGGSEKILLTSFVIDMQGVNLIPSMSLSDWIEIGEAATLSGAGEVLTVTNTKDYAGYAYINTSIPTGTLCDLTVLDQSGNASVNIGNTIPNSSELISMSSGATGPNTLTGQFTTSSDAQIVSLGNTSAISGDSASFDNVQITYPSTANLLIGDDSTFATSIGNWVGSEVGGASSVASVLTLTNMIAETLGAEAEIAQTVILSANSEYQFELVDLVGGIFEVLDGVTVIATASADGIVKFSTTATTSYSFRYYNPTLTINNQVTLGQVNVFSRLDGLTIANSTFTSVVSWKALAFDNVQYIGNGLELSNNLEFGAEISRNLTGLINGTVYRVQMLGYDNDQLLIGDSIGNGSLLTANGIVDTTFTSNGTTAVITLRVNSTIIGASAKFIDVNVFIDNHHNARIISPSNSRSTGGNLKALSTNNTSNTIKTEISVSGHGTFKVKGDSKIAASAELGILNGMDSSVASWVIDIPKMKPTSTSLAYNITEILL